MNKKLSNQIKPKATANRLVRKQKKQKEPQLTAMQSISNLNLFQDPQLVRSCRRFECSASSFSSIAMPSSKLQKPARLNKSELTASLKEPALSIRKRSQQSLSSLEASNKHHEASTSKEFTDSNLSFVASPRLLKLMKPTISLDSTSVYSTKI